MEMPRDTETLDWEKKKGKVWMEALRDKVFPTQRPLCKLYVTPIAHLKETEGMKIP